MNYESYSYCGSVEMLFLRLATISALEAQGGLELLRFSQLCAYNLGYNNIFIGSWKIT